MSRGETVYRCLKKRGFVRLNREFFGVFVQSAEVCKEVSVCDIIYCVEKGSFSWQRVLYIRHEDMSKRKEEIDLKYQLESLDKQAYLDSTEFMDWKTPIIQKKAEELFKDCRNDREKIKVAFDFVRDQIPHSGDIQSHKITHTASEALQEGEGVCYVKSLLLAALLRSQGIETGLCYQRLARANDHIIHGLNAVYLKDLEKWVRVDARGNLPGKTAEFYVEEPDREQLVFPIREDEGEVDYPVIYANPPKVTTQVLAESDDCMELLKGSLPDKL